MKYNVNIECVIGSINFLRGDKYIMSLDADTLVLPRTEWKTDYHHEVRTLLSAITTLSYQWINPRILEIVTVGSDITVLIGGKIPYDTTLTNAHWVNIVTFTDPSDVQLAADLSRRVFV